MNYGKKKASQRQKKITSKSTMQGKRVGVRLFKAFLLCLLFVGIAGVVGGGVFVKKILDNTPEVSPADVKPSGYTTFVYADDGKTEIQRFVASGANRVYKTLDEIPADLQHAFIAIEDERFYDHNGIDLQGIARAAMVGLTSGNFSEGASTLTQQLIKNNVFPEFTEEKTFYDRLQRKIQEQFLALEIEKQMSKEEILEAYLNTINLGQNSLGVQSAAQRYFAKDVSELTLSESAVIAGITQSPSGYNPVTNPEANAKRRQKVLDNMLDQGYISQEEYDQAVAEELHFVGVNSSSSEDAPVEAENLYSWYEEVVISDVWDDLQKEYNYSDQVVSLMLSKGGLRIYTCIDPEVQAQAEAVYEDESNLNYTSGSQRLQSAITIIDNETGDVAAVVGRIGEKEINRGFNLATNAKRQPGSSIKPLTAYSPALEMGLITPYTVLPDYPYQVMGGSAWPVNVDGRYRGQTTVLEAVKQSFNTVAVRTVADIVTPAKAFEFGTQRFHLPLISDQVINGQHKTDIDTSPLALGGLSVGVSTRDMANAFSTFPNNGIYRQARTYTRVEDSNGNVLLDNTREDEQAIKDTTAYYINYMLTQVVSGANGGGYEARLSGMTAAGKTGTTDSKDNRWFVGYTPYYTAAVWVGYETPARVQAPGNPAAQMWKKVMQPVHEGLENRDFSQPNGLVAISYCLDCGGEPTAACQNDPRGSARIGTGYVFAEDRPSFVCTCHSLEEGSNSMVRVCVDDPILDENGEFTGYYRLAGPNCPEVSVRTYAYLNLERPNVGGAWAEDSQYFYSAYLAAAGTTACTVHGEGGLVVDPNDPNGGLVPGTDPDGSGGQPGTDDPGDIADQPGGDDPGGAGSSSSSSSQQPAGSSEGDVAINPETGRPYGY